MQKRRKEKKIGGSSPSCRLPLLHFSCPVHPRLLARDLSPRRLHPLIPAPASTAPPPTTSNPASPAARFRGSFPLGSSVRPDRVGASSSGSRWAERRRARDSGPWRGGASSPRWDSCLIFSSLPRFIVVRRYGGGLKSSILGVCAGLGAALLGLCGYEQRLRISCWYTWLSWELPVRLSLLTKHAGYWFWPNNDPIFVL